MITVDDIIIIDNIMIILSRCMDKYVKSNSLMKISMNDCNILCGPFSQSGLVMTCCTKPF